MESSRKVEVLNKRLGAELNRVAHLADKLQLERVDPMKAVVDATVDCQALHDLCLAADAAVITAQQVAAAAQAALDTQCAVRDALYNEYITNCDGM